MAERNGRDNHFAGGLGLLAVMRNGRIETESFGQELLPKWPHS